MSKEIGKLKLKLLDQTIRKLDSSKDAGKHIGDITDGKSNQNIQTPAQKQV